MGEIGHQRIQVPLAAAISPLAISPSTLINNNTMSKDQTTTPGTQRPTLFDKCVGSLTSPASLVKMQETGPMVYRPYPRRLEYLTICRCHCKGSIFSSVILRL